MYAISAAKCVRKSATARTYRSIFTYLNTSWYIQQCFNAFSGPEVNHARVLKWFRMYIFGFKYQILTSYEINGQFERKQTFSMF